MKEYLERGIIGMGISFFITNLWISLSGPYVSAQALIKSYWVWMIAGVFFGLMTGILDNKSLKPMTAKLLHGLGCYLIAITAVAISLGGIPFNLFFFTLQFLIIYTCIYGFFYLLERREMKALNEELKKHSEE